MANRQRGEVSIDIDGQTYRMRIDLNAMCDLEDLLSTPGKQVSFQDIVGQLSRMNMRYMRAFFWSAMHRQHPDLKLTDVADLIEKAGGLERFTELINPLVSATQPDPEDAKELKAVRPTKAQAAKAGTGTR